MRKDHNYAMQVSKDFGYFFTQGQKATLGEIYLSGEL